MKCAASFPALSVSSLTTHAHSAEKGALRQLFLGREKNLDSVGVGVGGAHVCVPLSLPSVCHTQTTLQPRQSLDFVLTKNLHQKNLKKILRDIFLSFLVEIFSHDRGCKVVELHARHTRSLITFISSTLTPPPPPLSQVHQGRGAGERRRALQPRLPLL